MPNGAGHKPFHTIADCSAVLSLSPIVAVENPLPGNLELVAPDTSRYAITSRPDLTPAMVLQEYQRAAPEAQHLPAWLFMGKFRVPLDCPIARFPKSSVGRLGNITWPMRVQFRTQLVERATRDWHWPIARRPCDLNAEVVHRLWRQPITDLPIIRYSEYDVALLNRRWAHRGERVGEANNPGPPEAGSSSGDRADSPPPSKARWSSSPFSGSGRMIGSSLC